MSIIELVGQITEDGKLEAQLPEGLPAGKVNIILEIIDPQPTWTDEELEELLRPVPPMTGAQIVAAGLLGGWEDAD